MTNRATPQKNRPNAAKRRFIHITSKIEHYQHELKKLQSVCPHKNKTEQYTFVPFPDGTDVRWRSFNCRDCGAHWGHIA